MVSLIDINRIFFSLVNFWLHWVFVATHRLSLVEASGGCSRVAVMGVSLWWLLLGSTGSRASLNSCGTWS